MLLVFFFFFFSFLAEQLIPSPNGYRYSKRNVPDHKLQRTEFCNNFSNETFRSNIFFFYNNVYTKNKIN